MIGAGVLNRQVDLMEIDEPLRVQVPHEEPRNVKYEKPVTVIKGGAHAHCSHCCCALAHAPSLSCSLMLQMSACTQRCPLTNQ
jgi:hypothetical protein